MIGIVQFVLFLALVSAVDVSVNIKNGDQFDIVLNGDVWFTSAPMTYLGNTLSLQSATNNEIGVNNNGKYERSTFLYHTKDGSDFRLYIENYGNTIIFSQEWSHAKTVTDGDLLACFPCLKVDLKDARGYLVYKGQMAGEGAVVAKFDESVSVGGLDVGPLAFWNADASVVAVFSAASRFMSSQTLVQNGVAMFGPQPKITEIPDGYRMETIMHISVGVNKAFMEWGAFLLTKYGKTRHTAESDMTCNNLGYSTDNGAWYYYNTEPKKNYEDTILDIAKNSKLPYRHILLDSWWYFQGVGGGVKEWAPRPDVFPHGMQFVHNATDLAIMAHNRYWASDTVYAKQNGGDFKFIVEKSKAIPTEDRFWDFLIAQAADWGITVYEQDWLHNECEMQAIQESATLARNWLLQMGKACSNHGLTVQYCMSYGRHILQSLEIPAVTQARISDDYHPGNTQWVLGITSLFAHSIAIRGSKDNYWTNSTEKGRYKNRTEPWPRLQTVSSILSRGPVYISDEIGTTDVDLVRKTCSQDGTLLQPSKPCTLMDKAFLGRSGFNSFTGEIWSSYSDVGMMRFTQLMVAKAPANSVFLADLGLQRDQVYYEANSTATVQRLGASDTIAWPSNDEFTFHYYNIAPLYGENAFLGEVDKFVAVSPDRFLSIDADSHGFAATMRGTVGEEVTIRCFIQGKVASQDHVFVNDVDVVHC